MVTINRLLLCRARGRALRLRLACRLLRRVRCSLRRRLDRLLPFLASPSAQSLLLARCARQLKVQPLLPGVGSRYARARCCAVSGSAASALRKQL